MNSVVYGFRKISNVKKHIVPRGLDTCLKTSCIQEVEAMHSKVSCPYAGVGMILLIKATVSSILRTRYSCLTLLNT